MSTPPDIVEWVATPEDVAAILRARTKDDTGRELGVWSDSTRPTLPEVQQLIDLAAAQIAGPSGPGDRCAPICRAAIAYQAACLIELSYFPEQVRSDRSPYSELKDLLDQTLEALTACVEGGASGGSQGGGEGYSYHSLNVDPETTAMYYGGAPWGWRYPEHPATWQLACVAPTPETPADIVELEPPPEPLQVIEIGYPGEGDAERGLPPVITDET